MVPRREVVEQRRAARLEVGNRRPVEFMRVTSPRIEVEHDHRIARLRTGAQNQLIRHSRPAVPAVSGAVLHLRQGRSGGLRRGTVRVELHQRQRAENQVVVRLAVVALHDPPGFGRERRIVEQPRSGLHHQHHIQRQQFVLEIAVPDLREDHRRAGEIAPAAELVAEPGIFPQFLRPVFERQQFKEERGTERRVVGRIFIQVAVGEDAVGKLLRQFPDLPDRQSLFRSKHDRQRIGGDHLRLMDIVIPQFFGKEPAVFVASVIVIQISAGQFQRPRPPFAGQQPVPVQPPRQKRPRPGQVEIRTAPGDRLHCRKPVVHLHAELHELRLLRRFPVTVAKLRLRDHRSRVETRIGPVRPFRLRFAQCLRRHPGAFRKKRQIIML